MKKLMSLLAVAAFVLSSSVVSAEEIKSGLQPNKLIGAFYVTKVTGAAKDGVKAGQNLCYRCKNGGRPQVMVFTRANDKKVNDLVAKLDKALEANKKSQLRAFVNVLAEDKTSATKAAKAMAKKSKAKHVPFVVPNEVENGPADYGLNAKAAVTILLCEGGKVKSNHAAKTTKELNVDQVIKDLKKILN